MLLTKSMAQVLKDAKAGEVRIRYEQSDPVSDEYHELLDRINKAEQGNGKEARAIHRELKKYGTGLFFHDRYPNADLLIGVLAVAMALAVFVLKVIMA